MAQELFALDGKVAIVTGASAGIGRALALAFAECGMRVVVADVNLDGLHATVTSMLERGATAVAQRCDVSVVADAAGLVERTVTEYQRLDVLVNSAAAARQVISVLDMTEEDWDRVIDVNLKGTFICSQAAARVMSEGASIINLSSQFARVALPGRAHYIASKGGVEALTRALAVELAPAVRVNTLAPGPIVTERNIDVMKDPDKSRPYTSRMLLNRLGDPTDLVGAAIFLASPASAFVTGTELRVDGGYLTT